MMKGLGCDEGSRREIWKNVQEEGGEKNGEVDIGFLYIKAKSGRE